MSRNSVPSEHFDEDFDQAPPPDPSTFCGIGRGVIEVLGVPSDFDFTIENLAEEVQRRISGLDQTFGHESSRPILDLEEARKPSYFIDNLRDLLQDRKKGRQRLFEDLSGHLVVREEKGGRGGKIIYLLLAGRNGQPVSGIDPSKFANPSRLVEEKKYAFLRQLERQHPGRVNSVHIPIDPDYRNWTYVREALYGAWFDGEITERQLEKGMDLAFKLAQICDSQKPYVAIIEGRERSVDITDFLTYDESNNQYYLNLVFVDKEDGPEAKIT